MLFRTDGVTLQGFSLLPSLQDEGEGQTHYELMSNHLAFTSE